MVDPNYESDVTSSVSPRKQYKLYRDLEQKWVKESREAGAVICTACIYRDYKKGSIKNDWKDYIVTDRVSGPNKTISGKLRTVIEWVADFKCKAGHGNSVVYSDEEYQNILNRGSSIKAK